MKVLGIDIGGSGIKGAPVDTKTGTLLQERLRIPTPEKVKPNDVAEVVGRIAKHFEWEGIIGCGFPAAMQHGVARTAANVHKRWIGMDAEGLLSQATDCPVRVINDADAAGLAEMRFGAGKGRQGVVLIVTVGTGLGSALFTDGHLVPNTELGHIELGGADAELNASDAARKRFDLSWAAWAGRFDYYLEKMCDLFWPDLIIIGGGASKRMHKFSEYLTVNTEVVAAQLLNDAGIIGAALSGESLK